MRSSVSIQRVILSATVMLFLLGVFQRLSVAAEGESAWKSEPGLYAVLDTNHGTIVCKLFEKSAPKTVENFVGLAEGKKEWTDPRTGETVKKRYFDGLIFHRVIKDFMIQTGDPTGTGRGGPGYNFEDEFDPNLKFDRAGRLGMANPGRPNMNGSQFFITHKATPWLSGRHTIFGQVVEGQKVVETIGNVEANAANNRPIKDVILKKVDIVRVPEKKKK